MRHVTGAAVIMLVLVFVAFLYVQSPSYPPSQPAPGPLVAGGPPAPAPAQNASFATGTGTNLTASAEDFSGGKWRSENLAVAAATAKAPDGSTGAYNLTETAVDGRHRAETIVAGMTPGSSYTLSIFIRPAGRHLMEFEMRDKTPGKYSVVRFDLNRKAVDDVKGDSDASGVQELPDGWLRIWAAMPYTGDEAVFDIALMDDKGEVMYAGVANEGVSVWGVQFEPGNGPREYSTTLAATPAPAQKASFATGTGTNLTASAEDFSGGKWRPESLAVAAATAKAPDGSTGAYNLTETAVDGRHRAETIAAGMTPGSSYTLSIFIRPAGRHLMEFEMRDKTPGKYSVVRFDLNRKAVDGVKGDSDASGVQELPDGWLRIWGAMPYTGDEAVFDIALMDDEGEVMYPGVANEGVSVWGVQFEPGNRPREYSTTLAAPK